MLWREFAREGFIACPGQLGAASARPERLHKAPHAPLGHSIGFKLAITFCDISHCAFCSALLCLAQLTSNMQAHRHAASTRLQTAIVSASVPIKPVRKAAAAARGGLQPRPDGVACRAGFGFGGKAGAAPSGGGKQCPCGSGELYSVSWGLLITAGHGGAGQGAGT